MTVVASKATPAQIANALQRLALAVGGRTGDLQSLVKGIQLRVATAQTAQVQRDFVAKARGGKGSDGITWPPLKPATIAARRATAKEKRAAKKSPLGQRAFLAGRKVEILRDRGELGRSFSPGAPGNIIRLMRGYVIVGTNKKPWHHRGNKNLPARPFWPDGKRHKAPPGYYQPALKALQSGLTEAAVRLVTGRA